MGEAQRALGFQASELAVGWEGTVPTGDRNCILYG